MAGGERFYIRKTIRHLTANRIVVFKTGILRFPFIYFFHDLTEPVQRLCRLGEKTNITAEIQTVQVFYLFNHNGRTISLADKVYVLSARPATIKAVLPIRLTLPDASPLAARNAPEFPYYFKQLWEELTDETTN